MKNSEREAPEPLPPIPTNQIHPHRRRVMEQAIRTFKRPIHALEVGSWFGEGSTRVWLENLHPGSTLTLVDAWRPYASSADRLEDREWDYAAMDGQASEAFLATFLAVRRFETAYPGRVSVDIIRGDSERVLERLRTGIFDFIYIDGDHKYSSVVSNLREAKRLARNDLAMICGDDLEKLPSPELLELARRHLDRDFLRPPHEFHPGVMLAVHEELGSVSMDHGFWWVIKGGGRYFTG
jgi:predicted O-methyltransferase YrrM